MHSDAGDTTQLVPGYPIRTPWDHSSVDSSPRPIAASHVLHRLLVPRHPPFALDNLTTKMLASTVQFSTNNQPTTHDQPPQPGNRRRYGRPGVPGDSIRNNNPTLSELVPSGPNRVFMPSPAAPPRPFHSPRGVVLGQRGRCQG